MRPNFSIPSISAVFLRLFSLRTVWLNLFLQHLTDLFCKWTGDGVHTRTFPVNAALPAITNSCILPAILYPALRVELKVLVAKKIS